MRITKMSFKLSKTDYLVFCDCNKNAWMKIHKPEIYRAYPLSLFERNIIETGNIIDSLARDIFPDGILISSRNDEDYTNRLVMAKTKTIYQPAFSTDRFAIACDILVWNESKNAYDLYEVKSSSAGENDNDRKDEDYHIDIAFQKIVLVERHLPFNKTFLVRLDRNYTRSGALDLRALFIIDDVTDTVNVILKEVRNDMENAYDVLSSAREPFGACSCITRGRSAHCTTFAHSNPDVPDYSVHDIARIGSSKKKLAELVDSGIFHIRDVPEDFELSEIQRNQIDSVIRGTPHIDRQGLQKFLGTFKYPLSFLDYETYPSAIPRFDGYHPYNQIPFQFSLHILNKPGGKPEHHEFLYTARECPDRYFAEALKKLLPNAGTILVWNEKFEKGINMQVAERLPECADFMNNLNSRVIDLMIPFSGKKQSFVHPDFRGSASIKAVLPVLAPRLSYKKLHIQEGGSASDTWNKIVTDQFDKKETKRKINALREYCCLDTLAMVEVFRYLDGLINPSE
ncbi:MAG: DUF2779 domain-containing protein [Patescibacteria group bacterium]